MNRWLPTYAANDRSYVTVAVGCTGGRHRSVYITEQLAHRLRNQGVPLHVRHRELDG
ncbi:RNase adapter RapZ [Pseudomonas sp.]|uniref:RapZ C-terminal domain-containing protein n=1 Tax=Pseudomonas sp. TaxID=306 RepID=UPI003242D696